MCKALELAQMMNEKIIEAKNYHYTLSKKLQTLDLAQQDLLHKIENIDKFNLMDAWKMTKALNELRRKRRIIKDELSTMEVFVNTFVSKKEIDVVLSNTVIQLTDKNTDLNNKRETKFYTNKVLDSNNDSLTSTTNMLKRLNETNFNIYTNLLKNYPAKNDIKMNNDSKTISKIYNLGEKILKKDKGKGSSMKIRYGTQRQYNAIMNILVPQYKTFSINTNQKYFHLISKKF